MELNRTVAPEVAKDFKIHVPQPALFSLSNDLPGIEINAGTQDVVRIEILYKAGSAFQPKPLVARSTASLLTKGTKSKTGTEIAELFDFYGAFVEADSDNNFLSFTVVSLSKHLEKVLALVMEVLSEATFPQKEFDTWRSQARQRFLIDQQKVASVARREFNNIIFPESHPYHSALVAESYDHITRDDAANYWRSNCDGRPHQIVVAGRITDEIRAQLENSLGKLGHSAEEEAFPKVDIEYTAKQVQEEKEGAVQSAIWIGKPALDRTHPDYFGLRIAVAVLGGYFGSRLMKNIREEKGYTYGIGAGLAPNISGSFFYIATEVGKEVADATLTEIYKELDRLQSEEVSTDELETVVNYLQGSFLRGLDGPFSLAARTRSLIGYDLDFKHFEEYLSELKSITPGRILSLSKQYLERDSLSEIVVG